METQGERITTGSYVLQGNHFPNIYTPFSVTGEERHARFSLLIPRMCFIRTDSLDGVKVRAPTGKPGHLEAPFVVAKSAHRPPVEFAHESMVNDALRAFDVLEAQNRSKGEYLIGKRITVTVRKHLITDLARRMCGHRLLGCTHILGLCSVRVESL